MCGRFRQARAPGEVAEFFETVNPLPNLGPSWNIAPTQSALVVRVHPEAGTRSLDALRWGLVPDWAGDLRGGARLINARAETVAEKPSFRDSFRSRRCLVPAEGFYEWHAETPRGQKQPYTIAGEDGSLLAFAGLWAAWRSPDGEIVRTFTIVTTAASERLRALHERMPVMLPRAVWPAWLGEVEVSPAELRQVFEPAAAPPLAVWPVSSRVGKVAENDAGLIERASDVAAPIVPEFANPA